MRCRKPGYSRLYVANPWSQIGCTSLYYRVKYSRFGTRGLLRKGESSPVFDTSFIPDWVFWTIYRKVDKTFDFHLDFYFVITRFSHVFAAFWRNLSLFIWTFFSFNQSQVNSIGVVWIFKEKISIKFSSAKVNKWKGFWTYDNYWDVKRYFDFLCWLCFRLIGCLGHFEF